MTPMSQEQLTQIGRETERAANKVLRAYSKRALVGFVILALAVGGAFKANADSSDDSREAIVTSGRVVAVDGCNRDFKSIGKLRLLLFNARDTSRSSPDLSPRQKAESEKFYAEQLASIKLPDCREAEAVLTSDPNKPLEIPEPLYPGGPGTEGIK